MTTKKKKLTLKIENKIEKQKFAQISNVERSKKVKRTTKNFKNETIKIK